MFPCLPYKYNQALYLECIDREVIGLGSFIALALTLNVYSFENSLIIIFAS